MFRRQLLGTLPRLQHGELRPAQGRDAKAERGAPSRRRFQPHTWDTHAGKDTRARSRWGSRLPTCGAGRAVLPRSELSWKRGAGEGRVQGVRGRGSPPARCPPGPGPALTGLVVVVDPNQGRLQAPHEDVPLHGEGEAEGLTTQLRGEVAEAEGRLRAAAGSLAVP